MLHHVSVGVSDVTRAAAFYDAVLGALGYKRTAQYLPYALGYGEGVSEFWIQLPHDHEMPSAGNGSHVGFTARSQDAVHRFHAEGLANGGADEGAPGPRPDYGPQYYGAFLRDPFGNKVEATLHVAPKKRKARPAPRAKATAKRTAQRARPAPTKTKSKRPAAKVARRKTKRR